jgi:hypothetical protein
MSVDFNTPRSLLDAYKNGFTGGYCDPEDTAKLLGELPNPIFGAAAWGLVGSGEGKRVLLYKNVQKFDPGFGPSERQVTGDCLDGSTIIMKNDHCETINNINVGDTIYDSNGKLTKVISTQVKISNNPLITIKTRGSIPLKVTSDHRVLIGRKEENLNGTTITKVLTKKWVTAQEIKKGDYLITPTSLSTKEKPISKFMQNGFEWFLGYFLGDGWCDDKQLEITFAEHQETFFNMCSEYLSQFGFNVRKSEYSKSKTTAFRLRCWCPELASFLREMCYDNNKKKIFPNWAIGSINIINGLVASDGMNKGRKQIFDSSSISLAYGVYYSYLKLGYKPTINYFHRSAKGAYKETQSYRVICIFDKQKNYSFVKDDELYIPVSSTEIKEGPHEVYDIGVECKEHAFLANGCIAHNCVSHSTRNAIDVTRSTEIVGGERESWITRSATEGIYGSRGHGGQGMSCSGAARWVHQKGGVLLRKDYGFVDLSKYNGSLGAGWGRRGVPSDVTKEGAKHQVKTISNIRSVEEARDAIANGYAISVCSGYGFSSRRDKHGIARKSGSWSHAMAWVAMDDSREIYNETLFLVQNSWGQWNGGPKRLDQPDGSFWIRQGDAAGMLRGGGAWVFSDVDGFPPRNVDWTIDEVF